MMNQKAFKTILLLLISTILTAQSRENTPTAKFIEAPIGVLEDNITGWSYSLDGKWISGEKVIYPRFQSRNTDKLNEVPNKLGIDNFSKLALHQIIYGKDTLLLLIKFYEDGFYKYPRTKSGWKKQRGLHYFVFEKPNQRLDTIQDSNRHTFSVKLINSGTIKQLSYRNYLSNIEERINLEEKSNRLLHFDFELFCASDTIRFMIYSNHKVFHDLRGTVTDLDIRGKTLFGTEQLFDYVYFETTFTAFTELMLY